MSELTREQVEFLLESAEISSAKAFQLLDHDAALRTQLHTCQQELHDAKTQCGKNAMSHMTEYHRAERVQRDLLAAQERVKEVEAKIHTWEIEYVNRCVEKAELEQRLAEVEQELSTEHHEVKVLQQREARLREALQEMVDMESAGRCGGREEYFIHEWPKQYKAAIEKAEAALTPQAGEE